MEQEHLKNALEALLFTAGKPFRAKDFAKILEQDEAVVKQALDNLAKDKKDSGIVVLDNNGQYQLATSERYSPQVKNFLNAELREKLTDATVEVLAIIAYRQPISKAEVEAIRGVNCQYSVRNLLMRGLIEKISNPHDARSFLYQTTTEFLMHLGLNSVSELPDFEKLVSQIKLPETPALANEGLAKVEGSETPTTEPFIDRPVEETTEQTLQPQTEIAEPAEEEPEDKGQDHDKDDEE